MQRHGLLHQHLFPRPAVHGEQTGLAGDDFALRHRLEIRDAVGARDGQHFGIGIHRDPRFDLRREALAGFSGILRGADGVNFAEAQRAVGRDEAGIKMLAVQVDEGCVAGNTEVNRAAVGKIVNAGDVV